MTAPAVAWSEVAARLRPFVARRVPMGEVDDVVRDVLVRMHRSRADVREDDRFAAWMFRIARNAIVDVGRKQGHPRVRVQGSIPRTALVPVPPSGGR